MDNLTHTATGLFLSRAGLNRLTPHATAILLLAANAPDADVFVGIGSGLRYLNYHRHLTHSFLTLPLLAFLPLLIVRFLFRMRFDWKRGYLLSAIGIVSHLVLDWTNLYGIRLLLPLQSTWFRLDITGVIDFWIWAAIFVCILGPFLSRLVTTEIGGKRNAYPGRGFAIAGLAFLLLYDGMRFVLHQRALATLDSRLFGGAPALRVAAFPTSTNPLRWRGLVETADGFSTFEVHLLQDFDPGQGDTFYKPENTPALTAARATPVFHDFERWSQFPYFRVLPHPEPEGASLVLATDLRFGHPATAGFVAHAVVDSTGRVLESGFSFGGVNPR